MNRPIWIMCKCVLAALCMFFLLTTTSFSQVNTGSRLPMDIIPENSLESAWLAKEVFDARPLDDMENIETWNHSGGGEMRLASDRIFEGNYSLRLRFPVVRRDSTQRWSSASIRRNFPGEDWRKFNRISIHIYPELKNAHFVSLGIMFYNDGEIKIPELFRRIGRHYIELRPGEWNHVVWEIPDLPRDKVTALAFVTGASGRREGGIADEGVLYFDGLELQNVTPDYYEGWEVAPGKIAYSHTGYQAGAPKSALASDLMAKDFSVIEMNTGKTVLRKPVQNITAYLGNYQVMDFSEIREEGRFILTAGGRATRPFEIRNRIWDGTVRKNLNFWYCERCGQSVEGIHDNCHRDVAAELDSKRIIVNGGWHDAGDLTQMIYNTGDAVYAMFSLADRVKESNPGLYRQLIGEGKWGLEWMLKTRFGKGFRHNFGGIGRWTDGIIGTPDDFVFKAQNQPFENFLSASVLARAAISLEEIDPVLADESLSAAGEDWEYARRGISELNVELCGTAAVAAMNLYTLTGKPVYADKAMEWADILLLSQQQEYPDWEIPLMGFFYQNPDKKQILRYNPVAQDQAPILALDMLCRAFPGHEKWIEWYAAIVMYAEYVKKTAGYTMPFGMIPQSVYHVDETHKPSVYGLQQSTLAKYAQYEKEEPQYREQVTNGMELGKGYYLRFFPVWYSHRGNFGIQLAQAKALAVASHLRNDIDGISLCQLQAEWIVGRNPFSQSTMYGEGYDFAPFYSPTSGPITGSLPVGIQTNGARDVPFWPAANCYNYKEIWSHPAARWLWLMEDINGPASVTILRNTLSDSDIRITEKTTGKEIVPPRANRGGEMQMQIPEGIYAVRDGNLVKEISVLPEREYCIDFRNFADFSVSAKTADDGEVVITVTAAGGGVKKFELRANNLTVENPVREMELSKNASKSFSWNCRIMNVNMPWVGAVIPNDDINVMKEVHDMRTEK